MRLEWDLIREILLSVRETGSPGPIPDTEDALYGQRARHIELASEAGFIERRHANQWVRWNLTSLGCDLLTGIGDDNVWLRVKALAHEYDIPLVEPTIAILARRAKVIVAADEATRFAGEHTRSFL